MYLNEVRQSLLEEAKSSPNLLSDLAGLESYIAESYNNRSFIELLQNADDAGSTKFKIIKNDDFLFVANNGREFNKNDLESLCRSAASNKVRGETIGYRGIGFKSVVGFANEVHVISGNLEITFSKERTKQEIPQATRVPLIRLPHELNSDNRQTFQVTIDDLRSSGYSTIFIFSNITAQEIELEFDSFDHLSLLFLRNINETEICSSETIKTQIIKKKISNIETKISFLNHNISTNWHLFSSTNSSLAFCSKNNKIKKLSESEALVYSFLPTEEISGLGILINGDFNTNPSRKHLIYNSGTLDTIKSCGNHISTVLKRSFEQESRNSLDLVNALIPHFDCKFR